MDDQFQNAHSGLPREMVKIMYLIDKVSFYDTPEYGSIYNLIDKAMERRSVSVSG